MKVFPEHRDASSSPHELPSEPRAKVVSGKQSIYTHFPKDRNCEICMRTKITRAPCRKRTGAAIPRAENFGDLITADHKVLSEGCESRNNHGRCSGTRLRNTMGTILSVQNKTFQETDKSLQKFLEPAWKKPKSFTLTIHQNLAKLVKTYPGIIVRLHHIDQRLMELLQER